MKIAIISRFKRSSSNGVDRTVEGHLQFLLDQGHSLTVISREKIKDADKIELDALGVSLVELPGSLMGFGRGLLRYRNTFDYICLHSVFTPHNWLAAMFLGSPWITTPNGGYSPGQIAYKRPVLKKLALAAYERRLLEKALAVHVLSENEREQVLAIAPRAATVIAPNGTDLDEELDHNIVYPELAEPLKILFIGRVALMHKGLDLLIQSLSEIQVDREWRLDIVGPAEDGAEEFLKKELNNSHNVEKVIFHGPKYGAEKMHFLSEAHAFIHTSRYEGMPFSVIEALNCRKPVIVTPGTNIADLIEKNQCGWVVEHHSLNAQLEEIFDLPEEEYRLRSENTEILVKGDLAWPNIGRKLFSEVEEILSSRLAYEAKA